MRPFRKTARPISLGLAAALTLAALPVAAGTEGAQPPGGSVIALEVLPGWRMEDGRHMAGLRLTLAPGWKTYWRAPGDAGIPPEFDWSGSRNLGAVQISWPRPKVFDQNGMTSIGYANEVVLPVTLRPRGGGDIRLRGSVDLGVCADVCIPETLRFDAQIPPRSDGPDPRIAAALADRPYSASEAGLRSVTCRFGRAGQGMSLSARIEMPQAGAGEFAVVETGNPLIWVDEAETRREGDVLHVETRMEHVEGRAMALDRDALRITVLGGRYAVDIQGCPAG